jgi:hypothetical protein
MNLKTKLLIWLGVLALLGVVAVYVNEFKWFQNYISPQKMVLGSLGVGVLTGFFLGYHFQKYGGEIVEKLRIWTACLVVPILLGPLAASLINRLFAVREIHQTPVTFWEEKVHLVGKSPTIYGFLEGSKKDELGYFIFLVMDAEIVRVKSKTERFPDMEQGETVTVPLRKGLLGVDFIEWQD